METTKNQSMKVWIGCTLLAALAVVLQFITASFKIGEFSITFSLIPIIVATVFYGIKGGVIVGTVFGVTVIIQCITGMDLGGYFLFQLNPVFTVIACVFRAFLVGLLLGIIYKGISKALKNTDIYFKSLIISIITPILNTGIFLILYAALFNDLLVQTAASKDTNVWNYIIFTMVGTNFLVELVTTALLCPPIVKALEKVNSRI